MKTKKRALTNAMLDEIYQKLIKEGAALGQDRNSKPVYSLSFHGTTEEAEALKKRLIELDPNTKQPNL